MQINKYTNVYDEFGDPLKGAHLLVGQYIGTTTNSNGFAEVTANGDAVVRVSFVGKVPQYYKLLDLPKKITLKMDSLDEVMIDASKKKKTSNYIIPIAIGSALLLAVLMNSGSESPKLKKDNSKL